MEILTSPAAIVMTLTITGLTTIATMILFGAGRTAHGLLTGIVLSLAHASFIQSSEISPAEYALIEHDRSDCRVDVEVRRHLGDRMIDQSEFFEILEVIGRVRRENARRIVNHEQVACDNA